MEQPVPGPERPDAEREIASAVRPHREPSAAIPLRRAVVSAIAPLIVALIIGAGFMAAYVGALHDPRPKDVPVGVVRGDRAAADLLAAVRSQGRQLKAVGYDDRAAADRALSRRDVYAVLSGPSGTPALTLTTAGAAAPLATEVITRILTVASQRAQVPLTVTDAVPVAADDPRGVVPFYLATGLVIGGYFGGIALSLTLGTVPRTPTRAATRIGGLALHAVLLSAAGVLLVGPGLDIWDRHLVSLFGAGALLAFAAALFAAAVQSWLARLGTALIILLLVVLGNPGSGGIYPPEFLPDFFRGIHLWDIPGLGSDLIRSVIYFPPDAGRWPAVKLGIWCVASMIVLLAASVVLGRPRSRAARDGAGAGAR
ncbi:hypothetical protein ACFOOK_16140 [Micromonospora krabiensis]|uniref:ABC-2 family transporter protein n=1 Tax=Micromonospora krabiensis TaxID=307121 RepID=A0A1C3N0B3_9ACTN|nr:hypothetical protein [Micromonospora krabiensis]SBV26026.1 ABC-2 family transporter protein [Micromonospora krabiensis]